MGTFHSSKMAMLKSGYVRCLVTGLYCIHSTLDYGSSHLASSTFDSGRGSGPTSVGSHLQTYFLTLQSNWTGFERNRPTARFYFIFLEDESEDSWWIWWAFLGKNTFQLQLQKVQIIQMEAWSVKCHHLCHHHPCQTGLSSRSCSTPCQSRSSPTNVCIPDTTCSPGNMVKVPQYLYTARGVEMDHIDKSRHRHEGLIIDLVGDYSWL